MDRLSELKERLQARANNVDLVQHPPLTSAEVEAFEAEYGCQLPHAYRHLLLELGPFEDDCGFQITKPTNFTGAGVLDVSMDELKAFGSDVWAWSQSRDDLFLLDGAVDTVVEKRFPVDFMERFDRLHGSAGLVRIAQLDGVSGDLYLSLGGESVGSVWFVPEVGVHPEVSVRDGEVMVHDVLSWALSFNKL